MLRFAGILGLSAAIALASAFFDSPSYAQGKPDPIPPKQADPHYTDVGFFDIHVCRWPNRPFFYFTLFSTTRFDDIAAIEMFHPDGTPLGQMNLGNYRLIQAKDKPEKRVFITFFDLPPNAKEGWYTAHIKTKDGKVYLSRDYVTLNPLPFAHGFQPAPNAQDIPLPTELRWDPVPGATHYKVFVKDLWNPSPLVFESAIIKENRVAVPPGALKKGGTYQWRVHARDVNEDPKLGDFDVGSLSPEIEFSVADD